jgi:hypothetical protein
LDELGVKNCIVSIPNIPRDCPGNHRIIYYLKDIIATAKKHKYKRINIVGDVLLIHRTLGNSFYYLKDQINKNDWHILQYCCMDHKYRGKQIFNWQYYLDTNPDLTFTTETESISHWGSIGELQGRPPGPAVVETDSNNTLAFAISSEVYTLLEENLNLILDARPEVARSMPIFDFRENTDRHPKVMTIPNLFVRPKTGKTVARSLRWHLANYAF